MADMLSLLAAGADEPAALFDSYGWVALAMLVLFGIFLWKKVPQMIAGGLDSKIAAIKQNLDEAKNLRAEAEALRDEYSAKIADAEKNAEAMLATARDEASAIVEKAKTDTAAMIERRKGMAEDKIAAAERAAIEDVRETVSRAATAASAKLIAEQHDASADNSLVNEVISKL